MTVPCRSHFKADILPVAYTGQQKTTNGQKQTTIVKNRWILGHPNDMTPKDMMTSTFPKKLTGPRIVTRPATTTTTTTLSPNTAPHFWTNLSKHRKKRRANLRLYKKRWLRQTQQQSGYFPVSKGNSMDVDQGKGMSRGKKERFRTGKGKHRGKNKGKSKGRRPGPCLLCQRTKLGS